MAEEIKHDRRTFLRAGAMSIAAASLGIFGPVVQHAKAAGLQLPIEGEMLSAARPVGSIRNR